MKNKDEILEEKIDIIDRKIEGFKEELASYQNSKHWVDGKHYNSNLYNQKILDLEKKKETLVKRRKK